MDVFNYDCEGQMTIDDWLNPKHKFKIQKPIRLIELFAGIGAQAKALERLEADFEHYKISEWEVHAAASYHKIHMKEDKTDYSAEYTDKELIDILDKIGVSVDGKKPLSRKKLKSRGEKWHRKVYNDFRATHNLGSIVNIGGADLEIVDTDKYCYILTYSFPCQDLSVAGKQRGMSKDSGTRSGLLWEVERLLHETAELPDVLLMENVPQVHGEKFKEDFYKWCSSLEALGYSNFWQDLNAKNYGVAQSRNRTFMVSILEKNAKYVFPKPFPLTKTMKDYLEDKVDEKYYINNEKAQNLIDKLLEDGILDQTDRQTDRQSTYQLTNQEELKLQTALKQESMQEFQISNQMEAVSVNVLGHLDNGTGAHQSNLVIDENGLMTCQYAGQEKNPQKFVHREDVIENIKQYGNKSSNYKPHDAAVSYPLHSQDFVRTGFMDIAPTLSARDYKDPKITLERIDE